MSQIDFTSPGPKPYASLDELFDVMRRMTDDPLANAGTNIVISRGAVVTPSEIDMGHRQARL